MRLLSIFCLLFFFWSNFCLLYYQVIIVPKNVTKKIKFVPKNPPYLYAILLTYEVFLKDPHL